MNDKSHVAVDHCFWCGQPSGVLLHRQLRQTLPSKVCTSISPCSSCQDIMDQGITIFEVTPVKPTNKPAFTASKTPVEYYTGAYVVIRTTSEFAQELCKNQPNSKKFLLDSAQYREFFADDPDGDDPDEP